MAAVVNSVIAATYGSISDIEIVWTTIALVGCIFSLYNIYDARKDLKGIPASIQNGRRLLAKHAIGMEASRFVIQLIFFIIGLFALTIPEAADQLNLPLKLAVFSAFFRWGLIVSALLIMAQSYAGFRVRRILTGK